jgi:hypothetical protein
LSLSTSASNFSVFLISGGSASGGDSVWSDVDGDAVLETDGKKLTIDANVAELGAKARISTDTNSLEFNVGSGSVPEVSIGSDGEVKITSSATNRGLTVNDGTVNTILYNTTGNSGTVGTTTNHDFRLYSNNVPRMTISKGGSLFAQGVWNDTASVGETPNVCVGNDGKLFRSLTTTYSAEEVDKKLAIKDKLIEKLSARLDELEKRVNNGGGK